MSLYHQLCDIRRQHGDLTPELVVEEATNPDHPLHSQFEWDNTVAGHKYRLHQAGDLLRSVKRPPDGTEPTNLRAFVATRGQITSKASYVPTAEALADPFTRQLVLQDMEREWRTLQRRWQHMQEFADMIRRDLAS